MLLLFLIKTYSSFSFSGNIYHKIKFFKFPFTGSIIKNMMAITNFYRTRLVKSCRIWYKEIFTEHSLSFKLLNIDHYIHYLLSLNINILVAFPLLYWFFCFSYFELHQLNSVTTSITVILTMHINQPKICWTETILLCPHVLPSLGEPSDLNLFYQSTTFNNINHTIQFGVYLKFLFDLLGSILKSFCHFTDWTVGL